MKEKKSVRGILRVLCAEHVVSTVRKKKKIWKVSALVKNLSVGYYVFYAQSVKRDLVSVSKET